MSSLTCTQRGRAALIYYMPEKSRKPRNAHTATCGLGFYSSGLKKVSKTGSYIFLTDILQLPTFFQIFVAKHCRDLRPETFQSEQVVLLSHNSANNFRIRLATAMAFRTKRTVRKGQGSFRDRTRPGLTARKVFQNRNAVNSPMRNWKRTGIL